MLQMRRMRNAVLIGLGASVTSALLSGLTAEVLTSIGHEGLAPTSLDIATTAILLLPITFVTSGWYSLVVNTVLAYWRLGRPASPSLRRTVLYGVLIGFVVLPFPYIMRFIEPAQGNLFTMWAVPAMWLTTSASYVIAARGFKTKVQESSLPN
jgi:hypothetical protein